MWLCDCDCGCVTLVPSDRLVKSTRSCGCIQRELAKARLTKHGGTTYTRASRLYTIWCNMRARCHPEKGLDDYGRRGIGVCEEWQDFIAFRDWAKANGYNDSLSIDRIDVNGHYEPSNCRWATRSVQALNKRTTSYVELNGERVPTHTLAKERGMHPGVLRWRLQKGWDLERALTEPVNS